MSSEEVKNILEEEEVHNIEEAVEKTGLLNATAGVPTTRKQSTTTKPELNRPKTGKTVKHMPPHGHVYLYNADQDQVNAVCRLEVIAPIKLSSMLFSLPYCLFSRTLFFQPLFEWWSLFDVRGSLGLGILLSL